MNGAQAFGNAVFLLLAQTSVGAGQEDCTPVPLRTDSTPNSISIEWDLVGDSDHDATCNVQYRKRGSDEWLEAMPLFRVDYQWWWDTQRGEKPLNLFAGSLMFLEPIWMANVDFDGFDWGRSPEAFRWNNNRQRFKDLKSFTEAVGIEEHGVRVRKEDIFADWSIPAEPARVEPQHLTLKPGSEALDAGAAVPNIADDFVGKSPDLGAYEFGGEMPHYGPRSQ